MQEGLPIDAPQDPTSAPTATSDAGGAATPPVAGPNLVGSTVGRFTITARLGAGGMGEVYRAEDTQLNRTVAIKRLTRRFADQESATTELLREARRASALNHPRIASVYDLFRVENESFLVMEFIDGVTLRERLRSPMSIADSCRVVVQCTEALAAAHAKGILHGDIKPTNVMLTRDGGEVKVCDFGVARRLPHAAGATEPTSTELGGMAGTPGYLAPEAGLGQLLDARADVFSLGVVFYEMLAGRNPFRSTDQISTTDRLPSLEPQPLESVNRDVPAALARIIHRMIDKDPANRYASAAEAGEEVARVAARLQPAAARSRRARRVWLAVAAAVLVVIAATTAFLMRRSRMVGSAALPANINLVVLPFSSSGAAPDEAVFTQGLTEHVNRQLSKLTVNRSLQVASVTDVRARGVTSPSDAREQLGANVVLSGALQYGDKAVRVTCLLIDPRSGRTLRSETFSTDRLNGIAVQDGVIEAAIRMMGLRLKPEERALVARHHTQQPGANDFYLQGRGYLLNFDRLESLDSAISVLRRALAIDPRYALAYAGLGEAYWRKQELTGAAVWVEPARAACEGALGINADLSEPHACVGMVLNGTGEYEKAASEFSTALGIDPTNDLSYVGLATAYEKLARADDAERTYRRAIEVRPHYWGGYNTLGGYYYRLGRFDDALAMFQQVVALAPDSFRGHSSVGAVYFMKDRIPEAVAAFQRSLAIRRNYVAASNLGTLFFFEGEYRRSADAFRQAVSLGAGNYVVWGNLAGALEWARAPQEAAAAYGRARELVQQRLGVNPRDPDLHLALADYSAVLGDMPRARAELADVLRLNPTAAHTKFVLAVVYESRFGARDDALRWLRDAVDHGQTWREIDRSPYLRDLRADPRFRQMRQAAAGSHR